MEAAASISYSIADMLLSALRITLLAIILGVAALIVKVGSLRTTGGGVVSSGARPGKPRPRNGNRRPSAPGTSAPIDSLVDSLSMAAAFVYCLTRYFLNSLVILLICRSCTLSNSSFSVKCEEKALVSASEIEYVTVPLLPPTGSLV